MLLRKIKEDKECLQNLRIWKMQSLLTLQGAVSFM